MGWIYLIIQIILNPVLAIIVCVLLGVIALFSGIALTAGGYAGEGVTLIIGGIIILFLVYFIATAKGREKRRKAGEEAKREQKAKDPDIPADLLSATANGFIFGRKYDKIVRRKKEVDGHVLVIGGSGTGKSSCIAIPTLLAWGERVFAIDIKGELYTEVKKRNPNANIKVFNPLNSGTYGYNPFYLLKKARNKAQEAELIAFALIPDSHEDKDPYWKENARSLLTGFILHFYQEGFSFVDTMTKIQSVPIKEFIKEIYATTKSSVVPIYLNAFVDMADKTLSGIYSQLCSSIRLFATDNDVIDSLTREKNIIPDDLENGASIYIQVHEELLESWQGLISLIINQFIMHFQRRAERTPPPILFMLDEFAQLGKVNNVAKALSTLRSKKITMCVMVQGLEQLDEIYGRNVQRGIVNNCAYHVLLGSRDTETLKNYANYAGKYDYVKMSETHNYSYMGTPQGSSKSASEERREIFDDYRDLILPEEQLHLFAPYKPGFFRVDKKRYFEKLDYITSNKFPKKSQKTYKKIKPSKVVAIVLWSILILSFISPFVYMFIEPNIGYSQPSDFRYAIRNDGVHITRYTGTKNTVIIPAKFENISVVAIGDRAFRNNRDILSVSMPNSVTHIGIEAFFACRKLAEIEIPNRVTHIGDLAFWGCTSLTNISMPTNLIHIGNMAFGNTGLTEIEIPDSVIYIGYSAFNGASIRSITLPTNDYITSIRQRTFQSTNLRSIIIPEGVTSIEYRAFGWTRNLRSITLPNSLITIGMSAFSGSGLTEIIIPEGVTSIGDSAFSSCANLRSIAIPNSVTSIHNRAFNGSDLVTIITPRNSYAYRYATERNIKVETK
jgi:type IV secretion system protein VirD4